MAKTKVYSNEGQKEKELSNPIIRGKKYPKGTVVTNDPKIYQAHGYIYNTDKDIDINNSIYGERIFLFNKIYKKEK